MPQRGFIAMPLILVALILTGLAGLYFLGIRPQVTLNNTLNKLETQPTKPVEKSTDFLLFTLILSELNNQFIPQGNYTYKTARTYIPRRSL